MKHGLYEAILNKYTITGYLADRGVQVAAVIGNKIKYPCPIHKETKPSFMVYNNPDGSETFFCFGCHKGGNIITLYKELEGISFNRTIKELGKEIHIADEEEIDIILRKIRNDEKNVKKIARDDLAELSLRFADLGYAFAERLSFHRLSLNFLEEIYRKIDEIIWREDYITLEEMYRMICDDKLFVKKAREIKKNILKIRKKQNAI